MEYDSKKKYKMRDLRELRPDEVQDYLNQAQRCLFDLRHQCSPHGRTMVVDKPHLFEKLRKDIARLKTLKKERFE